MLKPLGRGRCAVHGWVNDTYPCPKCAEERMRPILAEVKLMGPPTKEELARPGVLAQNKVLTARIAALEAALAKAEEALEEAYQPYGSHFIGDGCGCLACRYKRSRQALAAIREVKNG